MKAVWWEMKWGMKELRVGWEEMKEVWRKMKAMWWEMKWEMKEMREGW